MRPFLALLAVALFAAGPARAQNTCNAVWPPAAACTLVAGETFTANSTSIQHVAMGQYAYYTFVVRGPRRPACDSGACAGAGTVPWRGARGAPPSPRWPV